MIPHCLACVWNVRMTMASVPDLETERLIVRRLEIEHISSFVSYLNDNKSFHKPTEPVREATYYKAEFWQNYISARTQAPPCLEFLLMPKTKKQVIGCINYRNFVRGAFQACHLGFNLGEVQQGKGYMGEALEATIAYMFGEQNFHRIMANYLPTNLKSAAVLNRLGFIEEGRAKRYLFIDGQWRDHILTSRINDQWKR